MRRQGDEVRAKGHDVERNASQRLHGVDMQNAARGVDQLRRVRDRLQRAGLVVGQHDGDECGCAGRQQASQSLEIDDAVARDGRVLDLGRRETPAGEHRRMLDRRDDQAGDGAAGNAPPRRQRLRVGLGAAGGEDHMIEFCAGGSCDLRPRLLDQPARGTAFGVHGGWIAGDFEGSRHRRPPLRTQRRGRIPVEIDTVRHEGVIASLRSHSLRNRIHLSGLSGSPRPVGGEG